MSGRAAPPPEDLLPPRRERGLDVRWHLVAGRPVRSLVVGERGPAPELVVVPGLGAPGYLVPAVRACSTWTRVHLLDLPGFGHRATARLPADLATVSAVLSAWLAEVPDAPVVLLGHSTGAQAALRSAARSGDPLALLVLAGVVFPPQARRLARVAARVAATLPHETVAELPAVLPCYARGARRLPSLVASALQNRPEDVVAAATAPLLVLRGQHDHLCAPAWAADLAARAPRGRVQTLPGAHNFPFTSPTATSDALRTAVGGLTGAPVRPAPPPSSGSAGPDGGGRCDDVLSHDRTCVRPGRRADPR